VKAAVEMKKREKLLEGKLVLGIFVPVLAVTKGDY
jgi:hypothetical protein